MNRKKKKTEEIEKWKVSIFFSFFADAVLSKKEMNGERIGTQIRWNCLGDSTKKLKHEISNRSKLDFVEQCTMTQERDGEGWNLKEWRAFAVSVG